MTGNGVPAEPLRLVLVIFFLTVQSSYLDDAETSARDSDADTVQFLGTPGGAWRIRTFALDQDVHVWSLGELSQDLVQLARDSTQAHYGDVLRDAWVIRSERGIEGLREELAARGLEASLAVSADGYCFWAPPGSDYRSRSTPRFAS